MSTRAAETGVEEGFGPLASKWLLILSLIRLILELKKSRKTLAVNGKSVVAVVLRVRLAKVSNKKNLVVFIGANEV